MYHSPLSDLQQPAMHARSNAMPWNHRVSPVNSQQHLHTMVGRQYMMTLNTIVTMLSSNATNMTCCSLLKHSMTSWLVMYLDVQCIGRRQQLLQQIQADCHSGSLHTLTSQLQSASQAHGWWRAHWVGPPLREYVRSWRLLRVLVALLLWLTCV